MKDKKEYVINIADIPDENGITDRQKNNQIPHNIPIGTLVEFKYDTWFGNGACKKVHARMFVWKHERDCDGTPLYTLSPIKNPENYINAHEKYFHINRRITEDMIIEKVDGLTEESLTVIELTKDIEDGRDSLRWNDERMDIISIRELYELFQNCYSEYAVFENSTKFMKFFHDTSGMIVYKVIHDSGIGHLSVFFYDKYVEPNWESFSKDVVSNCTIRTIYRDKENNKWCIKEETV